METLAKKRNAIYVTIHPHPHRPTVPEAWNCYVECDEAIHRVGRMPLPRGIDLHQGSQWFLFPRHIVEWFLTNYLPLEFKEYAKRIVVADETYFSTMVNKLHYDKIINHHYIIYVNIMTFMTLF